MKSITDVSPARALFTLSIPGVMGAVLFSSISIVEVAFLGKLGTKALAAVAVVYPLVMLSAMFSAGAIGGAISGATARALGANDAGRASSILCAAFVIALVGGLLKCVLVLIAGPYLYRFATTDNTVVGAAMTYAGVVFPAMPLYWLVNMLTSVMRGAGDMVRPLIVAAVMMVSYVCYASIFLEAQGSLTTLMSRAGYAMVLSYITALLVCLWFIFRPQQPIRINGAQHIVANLLAVLKQGLLASSQSLMTITYTLVATLIFSRFSTEWLAAYGLAVRLEIIMVPVIFGVGSALIAVVGTYVGAQKKRQAVRIAWQGLLVNSCLVGLVGLLFAWQPQWWCETFGSSPGVAEKCATSIRVLGPTYGFFAIGLGCYFASQGLNTLAMPVVGALLRLLIVASGLFWVTSTTQPMHVLWLIAAAIVCYGSFVAITLALGPWSRRAVSDDAAP